MSYSLTMDASHKVTKQGGHHRTFIGHIARDVDKKNGVEQRHSNDGIDAKRTHFNITMLADGAGGWKEPQSTDEILEAVEKRLGDVEPQLLKSGKPKAQRKDAVVIRPLVLQLDPIWFDENCPDWKVTGDIGAEGRRLHEEMLTWAQKRFGADNLPFYSIHLDEYSPQLQLAFVPVTEDKRLAQNEFFKGRESLSQMHTEFREHMKSAGYEVSTDRKTKDRHIKSMGTDEYKKYKDTLDEQAKQAEIILADIQQIEQVKDALSGKITEVNAAHEDLGTREKSISDKESKIVERETTLEARESALESRESDLQREIDEIPVRASQAVTEERKRVLGQLQQERDLVAQKQADLDRMIARQAELNRIHIKKQADLEEAANKKVVEHMQQVQNTPFRQSDIALKYIRKINAKANFEQFVRAEHEKRTKPLHEKLSLNEFVHRTVEEAQPEKDALAADFRRRNPDAFEKPLSAAQQVLAEKKAEEAKQRNPFGHRKSVEDALRNIGFGL